MAKETIDYDQLLHRPGISREGGDDAVAFNVVVRVDGSEERELTVSSGRNPEFMNVLGMYGYGVD